MMEMTRDQQKLTEDWFIETTMALLAVRSSIEDALGNAAQEDKNAWIQQRGRVQGMLSMVRDSEEEFFVNQTLMLRPPDQSTIDETVARCEALAQAIVSARRASAVARLIGDLGNFVSRILA